VKKIALFICISTALFSCSKKENWTVEIQKHELKSSIACEENNCTYVSLSVPTIVTTNTDQNTINEKVFLVIKQHISFENSTEKINNYTELMTSFIDSYNDIKKAFPNEPLAWEALVNGSSETFDNKSINIVLNYFMFTGGAHGNEGIISLFFDLKNGNEIEQKNLFVDFEGFKKEAEKEFRIQNALDKEDKINKNGHRFTDNKFKLAENIIFTQNEIILHYNKYEIAPYSSGVTTITLPMKDCKKYLNPLYF